MPYLNAILGDKGGVGKSTICRVLVQYLLDNQQSFILFDTDRTNPILGRIYQDICRFAIFSEGNQFQEAANAIYNSAAVQDVVVDCPAQVSPALNNWLINNEILTFAQEDGITIRYFFVTDGQTDSLKILHRSLERFGSEIIHIVIKNWGLNENWQLLENNEELQKLFIEHQVKIINFPKFHSISDFQKIDSLSLTFAEARTYQDFSLITRNRIRSFLRKAYAEFDQIFSLAN